ncbi:MAG: N-acetylglucosaminyldiphosphoundecaprenol [Parcubacteria group bacterium Gr01-1014_18]|nr:MAG: N-acetylglucosaminyldiphosphoundecaprenol [Parcubacteria group bacterium Greene0416_36]TSC81445.1 MAG: N-acetylglucosaminyldiphosphoundecaprenol [Parcubacteria group bacterium Gr01-1014_18]TSC99043.1 MAG: N-acetylglucosaminyldiphosphoundecaprenol [Parcubacteria group bacterium Greene1014_20]TSD07276.1 MAG: N-acetylglucosaminyldiphosphoundecaprenol [Parcubacteria group bacterium Greene0714_2]
MIGPLLTFMRIHFSQATRVELLESIKASLRSPRRLPLFITTPNPEIVLLSLANSEYRKVLNSSDYSIADGFGLQLAARVFGFPLAARIAGVDLMADLCNLASSSGYRVALLGAGKGVAARAKEKLEAKFPTLEIVYADPGMPAESFSFDSPECIQAINQTQADFLFCAFGAPKQELWIHKNLSKLNVKLAMGVGGSLDCISGHKKRAPLLMRKMGFEWLFRFFYEPTRALRIWNAVVVFPMTVMLWKARILFQYRKNVVALILDQDNRILMVNAARNQDIKWQFPQGGIDRGEDATVAVMREMREELGIAQLEIIRHVPHYSSYIWPPQYQIIYGYKGQLQDLFILRFTGQDSDFNLEYDHELSSWKWMTKSDVLVNVDPLRRSSVEKAFSFL